MDKEFIPYEESLVLKELGFNEPCFWWYDFEKRMREDVHGTNNNSKYFSEGNSCSAPLYQQAFRWFREKYGIYSFVDVINYQGLYDYEIKRINHETIRETLNKTYEEAELACLRKLIEIVKNNKV